MTKNPYDSAGRDPLEEFLKKLQEQGFDPSAMNGAAGFDADALKNMGIPLDPAMLSGIFAQVNSMMSAQSSDEPINWDMAKQHARQVLAMGEDPSVTSSQTGAVRDAAALADLWLDPVTIFERPAFGVEAWTKAEWVENSFATWKDIAGPVAEEVSSAMTSSIQQQMPEEMVGMLGGGNLFAGLGGMMFGMQMGQAIGKLAEEVVSSTDIGIPLAQGRSALLPAGVAAFGEGLEIPAQEVMLYLAVREAALIRLHKTNPWLREDIIDLIKRFSRGIHVDIERMQAAANDIDFDPSNPEAMMDAFAGDMFKPQLTEDQQLALDRLETLLALIEGWVSLVTEQATKNLPMAPQLAETMARRRATGGPAEHAFAQLVGLELRPRKMREALAFWRHYEENHGFEARDQLWEGPETLPTGEDLDDPAGFTSRRALLNASEDEFDAALEKLLAGGYDEPTEGTEGKDKE
ncbi:MAG TPA: zinc-dependent metalloprotease [Candidatus Rothia avistercoris]|uniref:Zinc-dependent metalloprotease n=1 Tax=Candidatus Rothia avistercoris TaxID=2840479 RepID=A0A9D2UDQ8_9MICC|nr:zinc-dependent metalloprotease [Candidatus Rothia avistercoris]